MQASLRQRLASGLGCALTAAAVLTIGVTDAQAYLLQKSAVSGGAVVSSGGSYMLGATVAEAGVVGLTGGGSYLLSQGFWSGGDIILDVTSDESPLVPLANAVGRGYPNPFRSQTAITYAVADAAAVKMVIYDVSGRQVRTLVDQVQSVGQYQISWDGRDDAGLTLGAGVYYMRVRVGSLSESRKMLKIQ